MKTIEKYLMLNQYIITGSNEDHLKYIFKKMLKFTQENDLVYFPCNWYFLTM